VLEEKEKEEEWVRHSLPKLDEESVAPGDAVTWAAYHASNYMGDHLQPRQRFFPCSMRRWQCRR